MQNIIKKVTVIIPVYNSPWFVESAVQSVIHAKNATEFDIVVYDDGSDYFTKRILKKMSLCTDRLYIHTRQENLGFIKTVNHALNKCDTPYAVLVNSDVIVTDGWIDKLVDVAESDNRIATVNPLTNRASQIETFLPPGVNFFEVNQYAHKHFQGALDVVTGVGFCMLLRMAAIHEVGYLDEIFGTGYCEESDLCMRLTTRGWRTVIAPNVYVYHKGAGSFSDKHERYLKNRRIFDERWAEEYKIQFQCFQRENPLKSIRAVLSPPRRWAPLSHIRQVYRGARSALDEKELRKAIKKLLKGALALPSAKIPIVSRQHMAQFKTSTRLSVTYILPQIALAGGVISVLQLVNELLLMGVDARLATLRLYPEMEEWPQYSGTMIFRTYEDLLKNIPDTDIAVATHWSTAEVVHTLKETGRAKNVVYFVQDYEPWFFPENDWKNRKRVEDTYRLISKQIVKSDWLAGMLTPFGGEISKIRLGMNLNVFYPRELIRKVSDDTPIIMAMARPFTPRRGFETLIAGLRLIKEKRRNIKIRLFGDCLNDYDIPFDYENLGIVNCRNTLAKTYSEADIFIDASDFQGFGRPALEAMACNTACVVTGVGGVTEYARNGVNSLVIPPKTPAALFEAVERLLNDDLIRKKIAVEGLATVKNYCHKREAMETAALFESIAEKSADYPWSIETYTPNYHFHLT